MKSIEETASRTDMTVLLSKVFLDAESDEIESLCYLLQGRVAPQYESIEFGIADKLLIRAIAKAYGLDIEIVTRAFKESGDLGIAAQELVKSRTQTANFDKEYSVLQVFEILLKLANTSGEGSQDEKILIISDLLQALDPLSVRYVVRIPLDKLRLGFSDMTILDAFSWMLTGDKTHRAELERAFNVRPDIGYIKRNKQHGIGGISRVHARVGAPILAALCQRIPTADEMIEKMGEVAVEPKYDGVRVQIHYSESKIKRQKSIVAAFSRNLENTTLMYPELSEIGEELNASEVILDCEAVGFDRESGMLATFQETMTRKRKHDIAETSKRMPLKFFVFDMLYKDGEDLLSLPLRERKTMLKRTLVPKELLTQSPYILTSDAQELREYHDAQLKKGLEGVVIKKWDSGYEPGRKNYSWVKFKEEEGKAGKLTDTIDAVIMGYSRGEGKRSGFGIGMFFGGSEN
jgi:DNA ligase-1